MLKVWLDGYKGNANSNGEQLARAFFTASLTFAVLTLSMSLKGMLACHFSHVGSGHVMS